MEEVILLQLNQEYTYKQICEQLKWNITTGAAKQRQIKAIESAYEFYHPENKKTHKPKKSYVFTKKLKDIVLEDGRKNNGGNNILFSDEEFEYLFKSMMHISECNHKFHFYDGMHKAYLSTSVIYDNFGLDIYDVFNKIEYVEDDTVVKRLFSNICIATVKSFTVSRICRKLGYKKDVIPKGVLHKDGPRSKHITFDDNLLSKYEEYEKEMFKVYDCSNIQEVIDKNLYMKIQGDVQHKFEKKDGLYGVKRMNVIDTTTEEFEKFNEREYKYDAQIVKEYQHHFREIVLTSVRDKVRDRINNTKEYKRKLNRNKGEHIVLLFYFLHFYLLVNEDLDDERYRELKQQMDTYKDMLINQYGYVI